MKASPLIRLYFDILSNKILKRDLPNWTSPFHYCKSDNYSSTAACAAARRAMGTRNGEQLA